MKTDVLIVGAGLSGLTAAYDLEAKGIDFVLVEKNSIPGGLVTTEQKDGFYFDQTGHWLHLRDEAIRNFVDEVVGLDKFVEVERITHIFSFGNFTPYPFQSNLYGLPEDVKKECLKGFIEAWCKKQSSKRLPKPKTFLDWVVMHMGEGIAKHFMIPYNKKLWTVHPSEMTPLWCQIYVPIPTLDEVIDGLVTEPDRKIGYNASFIYPKQGGIGILPRGIESKLESKPLYGVGVERMNLRKRRAYLSNGEVVEFKQVISSAPLKRLIEIIEDAPESKKQLGNMLAYQSVLYYNVALNDPPAVPGSHWIYVPEERFVFYRAGFPANAVASLAPKGKGSAYIEISHRGELADEDVWEQVLSGLLESGIVSSKSDILFHQRRNIEFAYVLFDANYTKSVPRLLSWLESRGILSIGRYGRWTYNSMETAMQDGFAASKKVYANLLND